MFDAVKDLERKVSTQKIRLKDAIDEKTVALSVLEYRRVAYGQAVQKEKEYARRKNSYTGGDVLVKAHAEWEQANKDRQQAQEALESADKILRAVSGKVMKIEAELLELKNALVKARLPTKS